VNWSSDEELFAIIREKLFTAVIGDVMDTMSLVNQFLPPEIRPLHEQMILVGRAMPVITADVPARPHKPFGLMLEALDDLKHGEVYVGTGGTPLYALWGELMSIRAIRLGAAGAVLNGYSRDTPGIVRLGFPTFSHGRYAQDQGPRGHVIEFRTGVQIGAVKVQPGDIIFGDIDGVLVIPRTAEREVLSMALEKATKENLVREAIENGMSAAEAFRTYGVM
jgi:regulator of RNase E activity RraA